MISVSLLEKFGSKILFYRKGEEIYREGDHVMGYYQISKGTVKLNNFGEEGKEFIQNIIHAPQSFGEVLLFVEETYPTFATALTDCEILHISKDRFFQLLSEHPKNAIEICKNLSNRMYYKIVMSQSILSQNPESKLLALMNYFKHSQATISRKQKYEIPLTRQQMADLTGLRVETVIRTIKKLENEGKLQLVKHKIIF